MSRTRRVVIVLAGHVALLALVVMGYLVRNKTYAVQEARAVWRAGFAEQRVEINGSSLNYAEGPDNGPPLLLLHGQVTDWQSYNRVLPKLSRHFHVFAVDYYGHGGSAHVPGKYTANALTENLAQFVGQVVGEPVIVSGHSSGGLVAAGLAASAPELVRGVVLEDPPFFSSVLPRARETFNYVDLSTVAHKFLRSGATDFTTFYIRNGAIWSLFQDGAAPLRNYALRVRQAHPDRPVNLMLLPPSINELFRAMPSYDARFGEAFYTGTFHRDFDHAQVLRRIRVPAVLIHANWQYDDQGILLAAMDDRDAERARSLLDDVTFRRVDSGHNVHFERPDEFIQILREFGDRLARSQAAHS